LLIARLRNARIEYLVPLPNICDFVPFALMLTPTDQKIRCPAPISQGFYGCQL